MHVRQPQGCAGACINHPGAVDGACCISTTRPRTHQHSSATTVRDHQECAGLPDQDRLPGDESDGRGRPT
eukprot:2451763-Pyramimonas_sp.AAC.1